MIRRVDLRAAQQESKLRQVLEIVGGVGENNENNVSDEQTESDETGISRNTSV